MLESRDALLEEEVEARPAALRRPRPEDDADDAVERVEDVERVEAAEDAEEWTEELGEPSDFEKLSLRSEPEDCDDDDVTLLPALPLRPRRGEPRRDDARRGRSSCMQPCLGAAASLCASG